MRLFTVILLLWSLRDAGVVSAQASQNGWVAKPKRSEHETPNYKSGGWHEPEARHYIYGANGQLDTIFSGDRIQPDAVYTNFQFGWVYFQSQHSGFSQNIVPWDASLAATEKWWRFNSSYDWPWYHRVFLHRGRMHKVEMVNTDGKDIRRSFEYYSASAEPIDTLFEDLGESGSAISLTYYISEHHWIDPKSGEVKQPKILKTKRFEYSKSGRPIKLVLSEVYPVRSERIYSITDYADSVAHFTQTHLRSAGIDLMGAVALSYSCRDSSSDYESSEMVTAQLDDKRRVIRTSWNDSIITTISYHDDNSVQRFERQRVVEGKVPVVEYWWTNERTFDTDGRIIKIEEIHGGEHGKTTVTKRHTYFY